MGLREMYRFVSKGKLEPFYSSQFFFRYISVLFSYCFIKLKISSNMITLISLVSAISGAILLSFHSVNLLILSILLMNMYNILDHCDGEVARYEIQILKIDKGPEGPFLDAIVHYLFTPLFFFALAVNSYNVTNEYLDLWAGLLAIIWLSSFGQAAALRVSFDHIFNGKGELSTVAPIWKHDKVVHADTLKLKDVIRKLIREIFSTQGQIVVVSFTVMLDLTNISPFNYLNKTLLLYCFGIISLVAIPRNLYTFFLKLSRLKS